MLARVVVDETTEVVVSSATALLHLHEHMASQRQETFHLVGCSAFLDLVAKKRFVESGMACSADKRRGPTGFVVEVDELPLGQVSPHNDLHEIFCGTGRVAALASERTHALSNLSFGGCTRRGSDRILACARAVVSRGRAGRLKSHPERHLVQRVKRNLISQAAGLRRLLKRTPSVSCSAPWTNNEILSAIERVWDLPPHLVRKAKHMPGGQSHEEVLGIWLRVYKTQNLTGSTALLALH